MEGCGAGIGPSVVVGAVVGRILDDGVVGDAKVVDELKQFAHHHVVLDHAVAVFVLPGDADMLRLHVRAEVHARAIPPSIEGLALLHLTRDEIFGGSQEFFINSLHPLFGQRAEIFDGLAALAVGLGLDHAARTERLEKGLAILQLQREVLLYEGLQTGDLTIGVGPLVAQTWLGDAVGALLAKHVKLGLRILDLDWWDIREALSNRRIDLAIGELQEASEDPDVVVEPLPHRQVCFYCRTGHSLLRMRQPTIHDIGEFPLVAPKMPRRANQFLAAGKEMGQMEESGRYFAPRIQCQNLYAISRVVARSDAVGIATAAKLAPMVAAGGIGIVNFHADWLRTNYAIMHLRDRTLAPAALAFCDAAREAENRYNERGPLGAKTARKQK